MIPVTRKGMAAPDIPMSETPTEMAQHSDTPEPDSPELGLIAAVAFALAILCLVAFVVFGA